MTMLRVSFYSLISVCMLLPAISQAANEIQINAARSYTVDARFNADGQLCVDNQLLVALKPRQPKLASDCEALSTL
jgi:hypothetical protein